MPIAGFENEEATFLTEQTTTEYDPIKDEEVETTEFSEAFSNVPVRAEQRGAEYVREVFGEWPTEVYKLWVDPLDIGTVDSGSYSLDIAADDRVEFAGVTGKFALQPPKLQRLDSQIPEHVELDAVKIEVD